MPRHEGTLWEVCVWSSSVVPICPEPRKLLLSRRELLAAAAIGAAMPRAAFAAAPDGQLTYGIHVSLAPTWFDPAETLGIITPFMVLYALHDAMVKPMPGKAQAPCLAEVVDSFRGRAQLRLHDPQGRQVPQRRSGDGGGRQILLRALSRRVARADEEPGGGRSKPSIRSASGSS